MKVTTQPLLVRQFPREGTGTQFEPDGISGVGETEAFDFGGKVLTTGPWRHLSTWLWVLLILAIAYYAFILLFPLPLMAALPAYCLPLMIVDDLRGEGNQGDGQGGSEG